MYGVNQMRAERAMEEAQKTRRGRGKGVAPAEEHSGAREDAARDAGQGCIGLAAAQF